MGSWAAGSLTFMHSHCCPERPHHHIASPAHLMHSNEGETHQCETHHTAAVIETPRHMLPECAPTPHHMGEAFIHPSVF